MIVYFKGLIQTGMVPQTSANSNMTAFTQGLVQTAAGVQPILLAQEPITKTLGQHTIMTTQPTTQSTQQTIPSSPTTCIVSQSQNASHISIQVG